MFSQVRIELGRHAPFTAFGALTGIAIIVVMAWVGAPHSLSYALFWSLHPLHVLLSAVATTAMYTLRGGGGLGATVLVGYVGSVGIATLSDSLIPFVGEWLLDLPGREVHLGFIEKWWLVNPLALAGVAVGALVPTTKLPHAGHVLLSTWASLFHIGLAMAGPLDAARTALVGVFLFLAVWVPCCTSDIVFPLLCFRSERPLPSSDLPASPTSRSGPFA